jgi:2-amino-4-hydroxy-6-hydroxymethyldihydropteridine diphosphokinase
VIGLGSNIGDRLQWMQKAVDLLGQTPEVFLRSASRVYRTLAVGPTQRDFFNAALCLQTAISPPALLCVLQQIEQAFGRKRDVHWGPRTIDLDILWSDTHALSKRALTIPHPELERRSFALGPLLEVAQQCEHRYRPIFERLMQKANAQLVVQPCSLFLRPLPLAATGDLERHPRRTPLQ